MAFTKNNKQGTGRPKGSKNKSTSEIKDAFQQLLSLNVSQLQTDLGKMSPKDKWAILLKLGDKILPTLKSVDSKVEMQGETTLGFNLNYNKDERDNNRLEVSNTKNIEE